MPGYRFVAGAVVAGLAAAALIAPASFAAAAAAVQTNQKTAIPAYWGPGTAGGAAMFQRLALGRPTTDIVVVNGGANKAQAPFDAAWAAAIRTVHDRGAEAIAYVDSGYYAFAFPGAAPHATRPDGPGAGATSVAAWTAQIRADIDEWYALYGAYGIDGIFLDQAVSVCGTTADPGFYADLYTAVRSYLDERHPGARLVINPGVPVDQCYEAAADTIVTFEGTYADYVADTYPTRDWQLNSADPDKFWHLVHTVPDQAAMNTAVDRSKQHNAGYVYATDDVITSDGAGNVTGHPWDTLPPYWNAELVRAAGIEDTSPPSAPGGLTGAAAAGTASARVDLTWSNSSDNVGIADYEVYRDDVSLGRFTTNAAGVDGLAPATTYTFRVRARDVAGNTGDITSPLTVTTPSPEAASILGPSACLSPTIATYEARFVDPFTHRRVFIDTDNDPTTGYDLGAPHPSGVDYMIENGGLYRYVGPGWTWTTVSGVSPLVSTAHEVYRWQVPATAFVGGSTTQRLVFQASSPNFYTATLTVERSESC